MIDHIALVTPQSEKMKDFYVRYFGGEPRKWVSPDGTGVLYFIRYENGTMLEMEQNLEADENPRKTKGDQTGFAHLSFRMNSREEVIALTKKIEDDGYTVVEQPTDYGCKEFFESCILDPDGNYIEIGIEADLF